MIEAETQAAIEDRPPPMLKSLGLDGLFGGKPLEEATKARRDFFEKLCYEGLAYQKRRGDTAKLGIKLRLTDKPKDFILNILMQQEGMMSWRVVEAPNLADIALSFIPETIRKDLYGKPTD
jgi:hypothetical protein